MGEAGGKKLEITNRERFAYDRDKRRRNTLSKPKEEEKYRQEKKYQSGRRLAHKRK